MTTIDISQIVYKGTGTARFVYGLTKQILAQNEPDKFSFFFSGLRRRLPEEIEKEIRNKSFALTKLPIPPKALSMLWNNLHILPIDLLCSCDLFLTSDWTEPPSKSAKKATIVHDLAFLRYPKTIHSDILNTQKKRLHWVIKETDIIITDSNATKNDIYQLIPKNADLLNLSKKDIDRLEKIKIKTIYPGVKIEKPTKEKRQKTLNKFRLYPESFFLTVGKIEPRKNLKRLIKAFSKLKSDKTLVIVGPKGWENLSYNHKKIIFTGYIPDDELYSLYAECFSFIYPSLWEGFGYPLIETALFKKPILCSDIAIFKELLADTADYFSPFSQSEMLSAMQNIINKGKDLKKISAAFDRARRYNWNNYYTQLKSICS